MKLLLFVAFLLVLISSESNLRKLDEIINVLSFSETTNCFTKKDTADEDNNVFMLYYNGESEGIEGTSEKEFEINVGTNKATCDIFARGKNGELQCKFSEEAKTLGDFSASLTTQQTVTVSTFSTVTPKETKTYVVKPFTTPDKLNIRDTFYSVDSSTIKSLKVSTSSNETNKFSVIFDKDLSDSYLPLVTTEGKSFTCKKNTSNSKTLDCEYKISDLPNGNKDHTYKIEVDKGCDETLLVKDTSIQLIVGKGSSGASGFLKFSFTLSLIFGFLLL